MIFTAQKIVIPEIPGMNEPVKSQGAHGGLDCRFFNNNWSANVCEQGGDTFFVAIFQGGTPRSMHGFIGDENVGKSADYQTISKTQLVTLLTALAKEPNLP